jgi:hypothetical protein
MRLWSIHPKYLDAKGLVAVWREGLLARAVLRGETRGYGHHPQLQRFRNHPTPRLAIDGYLLGIHAEAVARGYAFDRHKLGAARKVRVLQVTRGQLAYEWRHLMGKLAKRSPALYKKLVSVKRPACHHLFRSRAGPVAAWERVRPTRRPRPGR